MDIHFRASHVLSTANDIQELESIKDDSPKLPQPLINFFKKPLINFFNTDSLIPENNWVSHRIPYKFYVKAFYIAKTVRISFNMEVRKWQEKFTVLFLDVILYVLICYFQGFGETPISMFQTYQNHENSLNQVFLELQKYLMQKGSSSLKGNRIQMKKQYSQDKKTATIDYHNLDLKDVYGMTIAQYSRSDKNFELQTLNIITGRGVHSLHGVALSMGLILFFSCKNNLDSTILPNNSGMISFHIHRKQS